MGQEEGALAVAFSWEQERGMPESPRKASVVLSWEHEPAVKKPVSTVEARGGDMREGPRKVPALARRLSVPPPPGRPAARGYSRAVRPEDDPFLAAYLACTKSSADGGNDRTGAVREPKGQRRFAWGLGALSCKRSNGVMEQSMVRLAKLPELDPSDA
ncbi:hypothetical protein ACQJBY_041882 [Aegilops geniculata]